MNTVVDFDGAGFWDLNTGDYVPILYNQDNGRFYNNLTGDELTLVGDAINAARDTLIGIFGRQGYPNTRTPGVSQYQLSNQQSLSPGSVSARGVQVNMWALVLGGALVGAVLFGKRLGK